MIRKRKKISRDVVLEDIEPTSATMSTFGTKNLPFCHLHNFTIHWKIIEE